MKLEAMLYRDGMTLDEACSLVPLEDREEMRRLATKLPGRTRPPTQGTKEGELSSWPRELSKAPIPKPSDVSPALSTGEHDIELTPSQLSEVERLEERLQSRPDLLRSLQTNHAKTLEKWAASKREEVLGADAQTRDPKELERLLDSLARSKYRSI